MTATVPPTLDALTETDVIARLEQIRARRMSVVQQMHEAQEAALQLAEQKLQDKINRQCDMLSKEVTRLDALIEKCEDRVNKIRALRLEGDVL